MGPGGILCGRSEAVEELCRPQLVKEKEVPGKEDAGGEQEVLPPPSCGHIPPFRQPVDKAVEPVSRQRAHRVEEDVVNIGAAVVQKLAQLDEQREGGSGAEDAPPIVRFPAEEGQRRPQRDKEEKV